MTARARPPAKVAQIPRTPPPNGGQVQTVRNTNLRHIFYRVATEAKFMVVPLDGAQKVHASLPDYLLFRADLPGPVAVKLAGDHSEVSKDQQLRLDYLAACGATVEIYRPADVLPMIRRLTDNVPEDA